MKNKEYMIRNLTMQDNLCVSCACPAIYDLTPKENMCFVYACPSIHSSGDFYLIVGEQINPKAVGLEKKVGKGEVLIKIKKEIIDNKEQSP